MFPNDLKNILIEATLFNLLQAVNRIKIHEIQINVNQQKEICYLSSSCTRLRFSSDFCFMLHH